MPSKTIVLNGKREMSYLPFIL